MFEGHNTRLIKSGSRILKYLNTTCTKLQFARTLRHVAHPAHPKYISIVLLKALQIRIFRVSGFVWFNIVSFPILSTGHTYAHEYFHKKYYPPVQKTKEQNNWEQSSLCPYYTSLTVMANTYSVARAGIAG